MSEKVFQTMSKQLQKLNLISNCTTRGYISRYKLNKIIPCPDFIANINYSNKQKSFLLKCIEENVTKDMSLTEISKKIYGYKNLYNLNNILASFDEDIFSIISNYKILTGLTPANAEKFELGYRRITVKPKKSLNSMAKYLLEKSSKRARKSNIEYTLTEEIILQQLKIQDFKDYYTGLPLQEKEASVDRINSNLGYTPTNIVITTNIINFMKNNQTIEEFKNNIIAIFNNIENF
jgi:hypothetical protein